MSLLWRPRISDAIASVRARWMVDFGDLQHRIQQLIVLQVLVNPRTCPAPKRKRLLHPINLQPSLKPTFECCALESTCGLCVKFVQGRLANSDRSLLIHLQSRRREPGWSVMLQLYAAWSQLRCRVVVLPTNHPEGNGAPPRLPSVDTLGVSPCDLQTDPQTPGLLGSSFRLPCSHMEVLAAFVLRTVDGYLEWHLNRSLEASPSQHDETHEPLSGVVLETHRRELKVFFEDPERWAPAPIRAKELEDWLLGV